MESRTLFYSPFYHKDMLNLGIGFIIGVVIAWIVAWFIPDRKILELNQQTLEKNYKINEENKQLCAKREEIQNSIPMLQKQAEKSAQLFLNEQLRRAADSLDLACEKMSAKYQSDEEAYKKEYLATLEELNMAFQQAINKRKNNLKQLDDEFKALQNNVKIAIEANKRAEEARIQADFYKLILPATDLYEIQQLRSIEPFLRDKEALNKVIWSVYYEKPYSDLVGRVLGKQKHTGIYKITELKTGRCYVGQSVDIAQRWKQHIRRGLGADTPTNNKLYPAMREIGVENFSFELVENCAKDQLNEREKFWQEYFGAQEFGYSIR